MPAMNHSRDQILKAARKFTGKTYGRRHLQLAVCICRRNGLVSAEVLTRAGFNAHERRG